MSSSTIVASIDGAAAESGEVCERNGNALSQRTATKVSKPSDASIIFSKGGVDSDESQARIAEDQHASRRSTASEELMGQ